MAAHPPQQAPPYQRSAVPLRRECGTALPGRGRALPGRGTAVAALGDWRVPPLPLARGSAGSTEAEVVCSFLGKDGGDAADPERLEPGVEVGTELSLSLSLSLSRSLPRSRPLLLSAAGTRARPG